MKHLNVLNNYAKAVELGAYDNHTPGLFGKHDNVRRFWEDLLNRRAVSQFMAADILTKKAAKTGFRVMDLGCGAGEGFNILTTLPVEHPPLAGMVDSILNSDDLQAYKGVDISPAMINKATSALAKYPQADLRVADLNDGLPTAPGEAPYDLYFSSYAALSHLNDAALGRLFADIFQHMGRKAVFIGDFLGKFSYEWPVYWDGPQPGESPMRTYSMSYIYRPEKRAKANPEKFPMRFWGGAEFDAFITAIAAENGVKVTRRVLFDRSILVGRHLSTREYNPHAAPLREVVNSLFATNRRTDLAQLFLDYQSYPNHPEMNEFFQTITTIWNVLVASCMQAIGEDPHVKLQPDLMNDLPPFVHAAIETIHKAVEVSPNLELDDPRANLIEPQLANLLREVEWRMNQGLGAAHGLLALYELSK